jgi:hypothetical protein
MAVSRVKTSSVLQGFPKSRSLLAGNSAYSPYFYESIASVNGTGSSGTITLSSIPSGYVGLQIRATLRTTVSGWSTFMTLNGDTGANYSKHYLAADGNGVYAGGNANTNNITLQGFGNDNANSDVSIVDIHNYANTSQYKTVRIFGGMENNAAGPWVGMHTGSWRSTSAVNSVTITLGSGNFTTATNVALYGIRGA